MILRTLLSHYRRHPLQGIFLLTGITIANVLLVGTLLINAQARASYSQGEQLLSGQPVGSVVSRDRGGTIIETDYIRLRLQGFGFVAPVLRQVVRTRDGDALELLGIDPFALSGRSAADSGSGDSGDSGGFSGFAFPPFQLWAAPARMEQLGVKEGDRLQLASGDPLPPVTAVPGQQLGHRLLIDIGALQTLSGSQGHLTYLAVFPASEQRLADLESALPDHLRFTRSDQAPDPAELTQSFHLNLAAMGLLAFVVGIFLTYNALAFSYTDRHELIRRMKLSGVSQREFRVGLGVELFLFLGLGSALGYWLGAQLAGALLPGVGQTLAQLYDVYIDYPDGFALGGLWLPWVMTAIAAGLCVLVPMREALTAPLLDRAQGAWQRKSTVSRDLRLLVAALLLLVAAGAIGWNADRLWTALAGMAGLLLGAALLLPIVLRLLLGGISRLIPHRNARLTWLMADSRWLLGPAALALMAMTLALVANSGLNTMINSFRVATDDWLEQRLASDLYLAASPPAAEWQQWLQSANARIDSVSRYTTSVTTENAHGHPVDVEVVSLPDHPRYRDSVDLIRAVPGAQSRFQAGEGVLISEQAWRREGWEPGDRLQACPGGAGTEVLGVYHDYGNPRSQWMLSEALFLHCWPGQSPSGRALLGPQDTPWDAVTDGLVERFGFDRSEIVDQRELRGIGMAVFDRTFAVTHALNALTLLVAGIGIFCAVSAIHHHRVGHQALLASLGLSRRERGALLLAQWGLFGLLCMVLVWPFGTLLAAYLSGIVTPVAFGWSFPLRPEWSHYLVLALSASAALVLAVLLPSIRLLRATPAALLRAQAT